MNNNGLIPTADKEHSGGMFPLAERTNERSLADVFGSYFDNASMLDIGLFVLGVCVAAFIIIGIPLLLDKYGGENWK